MKITLTKSISRAVIDFSQNVSNGKSGLWSVRIGKKNALFLFCLGHTIIFLIALTEYTVKEALFYSVCIRE